GGSYEATRVFATRSVRGKRGSTRRGGIGDRCARDELARIWRKRVRGADGGAAEARQEGGSERYGDAGGEGNQDEPAGDGNGNQPNRASLTADGSTGCHRSVGAFAERI